MTDTAASPFIPGARVAISNRFRDGYTEQFVDKVHKSGRFTLRGSAQQWRPWQTCDGWHATQTGEGWTRDRARIWDETTDAEISESNAAAKRKARAINLRRRFDSVPPDKFTETMLAAIEAVLP
jgi:hypothetical protein